MGQEGLTSRLALGLIAALAASTVSVRVGRDALPVPARPGGKVDRKGAAPVRAAPLLGTLVDTHSPARLPLDAVEPSQTRFDELLQDPVMGTVHPTDPALLGLVRELAARHPLGHIDVVSGFRSPKLNEALRKKGHHVASFSQHSLGHALDLRVYPEGQTEPIDPAALAAEIRELGWKGGIGVYLSKSDRFVHADVGPMRGWNGL